MKRYAGHTALDNVNISIPEGCIFGLLGPNGAGKTSFIRIINQITAADEGEVQFRGERLSSKHIGLVGYLPEERGLYKKMKVGEQLVYLARLKGFSSKDALVSTKAWLAKLDLMAWREKNVEDLSKGMQQKVQFIATVLHKPPLIILDEPFSGFDPINANIIKEEILQLRAEGSTIIFSTHRMESVEELCDHIALLNKSKKVLDGKKTDIKAAYRNNIYLADIDQRLKVEDSGFEILAYKDIAPNHVQATVQIHDGDTNALLYALTKQVKVFGFRENIPSINEIFISVVKGQGGEVPLQA